MGYRTRGHFESFTWLLLNGLMWVGVVGIAWNLLKPGGWLYWGIDLAVLHRPDSYYYLGVGVLALLAGKAWLDSIGPSAIWNLLTVACSFAGTFFLLRLLMHL